MNCLLGVDDVGQRAAEVFGEGSVEVRLAVPEVEVDLLQFLEAQILHPGPVVECLGDDVPRGSVTLELEDVDASLGIEREEIDDSPEPGLYLPADDEQIGSAHAGILGEQVLETLLGVQRRRHQLVRSVVAHSPNCHSTAIRAPSGQAHDGIGLRNSACAASTDRRNSGAAATASVLVGTWEPLASGGVRRGRCGGGLSGLLAGRWG